jgi:hypothetical protein
MDHVIASSGLKLTYLRDWASIELLDSNKILDDLVEVATGHALCNWFARVSLTDFDHVTLATNIKTGRHVGLLVAKDGAADFGSYLNLRAAMVIDAMRGTMLMRRMLAYTLLRIDSLDTMPRVIVAQTSMPACYQLLSLFTQTIPGAAIFPKVMPEVIDIEQARLARQIVRSILPRLPYDCGTGVIRGAKLTNATCFTRKARIEHSVEAMFERHLGSDDQIMVAVDMQRCDSQTVAAETRTLVRSRWKVPSTHMEHVAMPQSHSRRRKPTLTA